ncbi:twin-arginine translocase TatA/TatE family subunit [Hymenobacter sp. RP-2-7]|uniref:Sec-independent protein translocase protein TatA n=1 Tax=Hymenobacter polaris TaxID=2682546 RepID=A0A7Y0AG73_9BACT|nr:twin-arginine translocase TatA/TatE family subunit [Hymenobacter polaris]NML66515.1 twin-arginine translocase TatA/TatE family subunit [Hymenobacter polaris]
MHTSLLFLGDIGGSEMILIVVVILIFFGANKIPELARGLGKGIREFKDASSEIRNEFERAGQPSQPNYQQPNAYQQPDQYQQPPYSPASQPYQPYQPHVEGYQAPPVAPTDYATAPPVADYHAPYAPPTDYTAPDAVNSPPAPHHHDTPIPPATGVSGVPGTRPRLDQTPTDV